MARHLLIPNTLNPEDSYDSVILLPAEGFTRKAEKVDVPKGIVQKSSSNGDTFNRKSAQNLLVKLAKANISRTKDGLFFTWK